MFDIVRDYSEYSTIQGVIYLFQSNQSQCGRMFWILVIISMLILGTYWSVTAYNDWTQNPVMTTVKTSALKVKHLEFPALTICGQGVSEAIITAGFFKVFYNYTRKLSISYGMSPIRTVRVRNSPNKTNEDQIKLENLFSLMTADPDHIMGGFLDSHMPGFKFTDPLIYIPSLLASKDPDSLIRMNAFKGVNVSPQCANSSLNESGCQSGSSWTRWEATA